MPDRLRRAWVPIVVIAFGLLYPTLLPVARAKGTLTPAYLAQEAAEREAAAQ